MEKCLHVSVCLGVYREREREKKERERERENGVGENVGP